AVQRKSSGGWRGRGEGRVHGGEPVHAPLDRPPPRKFPRRSKRGGGLLEPEIERRKAELGTSEHEGRFLEIVARVCPDRVDITPGPLDGVVEEDSSAAAGLEQAIDGANAPIRGLRGVPPVARPLGEGELRPLAEQPQRFGNLAAHTYAY